MQYFRSNSIRLKFLLGFCALLILAGLSFYSGSQGLKSAKKFQQDLVLEMPLILSSFVLQNEVYAQSELIKLMRSAPQDVQGQAMKALADSDARIEKASESWKIAFSGEALAVDMELRQAFERWRFLWKEYKRDRDRRLVSVLSSGDREASEQLLAEAETIEQIRMVKTFGELVQHRASKISEMAKTSLDARLPHEDAFVTTTLAAFFLALVLGVFVFRAMLTPLRALMTASQRICAGELWVQWPSVGHGEWADLSEGMQGILEKARSNEREGKEVSLADGLVEHAPVNIMYLDEQYKIAYINAVGMDSLSKLESVLPFPVKNLIGQPLDIFFENPNAFHELVNELQDVHQVIQSKLGEEMLEWTLAAVYDEGGHRSGTLAMMSLVTSYTQHMNDLVHTAESMALASEELSISSSHMGGSTKEVSGQAAAAASASEQTNQNVQTVAASAGEMAVTVREISKSLQEGTKITAQAVAMAEATNATFSKLGESSSQIGEVVKVITSIAQQTNLLALNATIEAARAGEVGKGFAVVANEVKELAKGTAKATDEISRQTTTIQENMKDAVEAIADIRMIINQISEISTTIAGAVEEQAATTNEITRNMGEAAKGTGEVVHHVSAVMTTSQTTQQDVENVLAASQGVSNMAQDLRRLVMALGRDDTHLNEPQGDNP